MIFAEFIEEPDIESLVEELKTQFNNVEWGIQGDAWIWINDDNLKVQIDNFTSYGFQVKCTNPHCTILENVISFLQVKYELNIFETPELENHE